MREGKEGGSKAECGGSYWTFQHSQDGAITMSWNPDWDPQVR